MFDPLTMDIDEHLVIREMEERYRDVKEKPEALDCVHDIMRPDHER